MKKHSPLLTISMIGALVFIWGVSWPIYKAALSYTPPMLFAGMRTILGGLALALIALPRWKHLRFRGHLRIYMISALLNVMLFFGLQTVGLTLMPGGLFSLIIFIQPVLVGIMAWLWLGESMSSVKVVGLILGFAGVAVASVHSFAVDVSVAGLILAFLTALSWAGGAIYLKKIGDIADPMWLVATHSIIGGIVLTTLGLIFEPWSAIVWSSGPYILGLVFGMILGVPTAWLLYFMLIRSGEASKVATSTFLVPVISVIGSTVFLHEPFHFSILIGLVMIAASIYLVNSRLRAAGIRRKFQKSAHSGHSAGPPSEHSSKQDVGL